MFNRRTLVAAVASLGFMAHCGNVTINKAVAQEGAPKPAPVLPSMKGETVVVAGATGRTGKVVVELLKEQGVKVRAFSRNIEKAKAEVQGVEWIAADVKDPASIKGIAKGADRMVIALGSNSFRDPNNKPELVDNKGVALLTDEAKAAGVKHIVLVSSAGVTKAKPGGSDFEKIMYNVMSSKLEGENYLRKSGVGYTILRPVGLWDKPAAQHGIAFLQGDVPVAAMIARADVAAVAVNALNNPDARNKTFTLFNVSQRQVDEWKSALGAVTAD
ncbi:MAG: SDR family oxidoreductase [Rhodospirillaceae bacterium]|nr:SDR family oxidoreductase [Rhodospirillaceae bacterium]